MLSQLINNTNIIIIIIIKSKYKAFLQTAKLRFTSTAILSKKRSYNAI